MSVLDIEDDEDVPVETLAIERDGLVLVGHGEQTNEECGVFRSFYGCLRVELHNRVKMIMVYDKKKKRDKAVSVMDKGYVRKQFLSCDKPSCPKCYKYGWAGREARRAELRLLEASKRFGQVEHIVVGFPVVLWEYDVEALRKKLFEGCVARNFIGGFTIFHGFRYNNPYEARRKGVEAGWYWSPHFHLLGFIRGGYKCRSCKKIEKSGKCGIENRECHGFVNRNYRENEKDGLFFKVKGKRKTIRGTVRYLLDHATIRKGVRRPHAGVWFGVCSYRKLKLKVEKGGCGCPICKHELVRLRYFGVDDFEGYEAFVRVFGEGGVALWVEDEDKKGWL